MKGCVRIYDPLHERGQTQRPSSRDSDYRRANQTGAWLMTFTTGFRMPKNTTSTNPSLASKKRIIDARWVSGGRAIVALLEDGEWGVWDVEGVGPKRANTATSTGFVINGFIGDMTSETGALNSVRGKSLSKLAPMTPNTRRVRQESLFGGSKFVPGAAPQGGLSASGIVSASGNTDDTIVLWYGQEVYTMPSLNTFWQRSINSSGRDPGSLYSPGLSRVDGVDLSGEIINNVYQFPLRSAPASLGNLAQRDLLVVGEHRVVVLAHTRPPTPAKALFAREPESPTFREDQHLLDRGELDLGGMDRILDGMMGVEATNGFGKAKRVGFAR
ncbi:hypothetical protein H2203_007508 [Taxawa tesnikishii (nom. ined.)]|nr:hypothetical protein H2203_007508 [Dothideales sp. JES 119]